MKKLSALIALALCITIGGVYATWNYAQGEIKPFSRAFNESMAGTSDGTAAGQIAINADHLNVIIDDRIINSTGIAGSDHVAEVYFEGVDSDTEGYVEVTFTPTVGADADIMQNGIAMQYQFSYTSGLTDGWKYEGTDIFTISSEVFIANNGDPCMSFTITAEEIANAIQINSFTLDTVEKYEAFRTILNSGSLQVTVSEYIAPAGE